MARDRSPVNPPHGRNQVWGREIPHKNQNFIGRERELEELRSYLSSGSTALIGQPVQAIYGLGGIGKTELAAEYAHRHRHEYELVWWIRAEREEAITAALFALAHRLGLRDARRNERDFSTGLVMDALISGNPYERWLLIFDDARDASVIEKFVPQGREHGHVIITSRDIRWQALGIDGLDLKEFRPDETVQFLRKRVPALAAVPVPSGADETAVAAAQAEDERRRDGAVKLAAVLGNLPLAAEHAAAYLREQRVSVDEYLKMFAEDAHKTLGFDVDMRYPRPVVSTWNLSMHALSPEAESLFRLLAFFGPEPVAEELLRQGSVPGIPEPLRGVLGDVSKLRAALRELERYSLIQTDGVRNVVQMHKVVQQVTNSRLRRERPIRAADYRTVVHRLLAASDPGAPGREESAPIYERSREHILASEAHKSTDPAVRQLIINQVHNLRRSGGYSEALALGEAALHEWRTLFAQDDKLLLTLAVEVSMALRTSGRWQDAYQLDSFTLADLKRAYGETDEVYLLSARNYGRDLSMLGRDVEALASDELLLPLYEQVFGPDSQETLYLRNNIAIGLRVVGRFEEALEHDAAVLAERERTLGDTDEQTLTSRFAVARDLRRLGRYDEALDTIRAVRAALERRNRPWNLFRLLVGAELSVCLRRIGLYEQARDEGENILERHIDLVGKEHRRTLVVATSLITDRRLADDLDGAAELGEWVLDAWDRDAGPDHPNTHAAQVNLAAVLRERGQPERARELDEYALRGFIDHYGEDHPNALVAKVNLASDLAALGAHQDARELDEAALSASTRVRGENHPSTLSIAANLVLDLEATGDQAAADKLRAETVPALERAFGQGHPQARLAADGGRLILDINPMAA
jgi:tetratricopeptide (TPR) repeat protein